MDAGTDDSAEAKRAIRRHMRSLRKALPDREQRSTALWSIVQSLPAVVEARVVMAFTSVPGEPSTAQFLTWCRSHGKTVVLPEDDPPIDPARIDVAIVPGTAFTPDGHRLGQGGGWYDRFLPELPVRCVKIGVCFEPQLVPELPVETHDVRLDLVVTDAGAAGQISS